MLYSMVRHDRHPAPPEKENYGPGWAPVQARSVESTVRPA